MRIFKLTRGQKVLRNCLLIGLCLFLLAWMLEFPCLTKQGLLNRAERQYLLNGPTELIFDREDDFYQRIAYGRNDDGMLAVGYETTLLGFREIQTWFFPVSDYLLVQDLEVAFHGGYVGHVHYAMLVGLPEWVARAELDVEKNGGRLLRFEAVRQETQVMTFPLAGKNDKGEEEYWDGNLTGEKAVLRLYDDAGTLLQEQTFDDLYYGGNGGGRIP